MASNPQQAWNTLGFDEKFVMTAPLTEVQEAVIEMITDLTRESNPS
jgi:hypothetical protein